MVIGHWSLVRVSNLFTFRNIAWFIYTDLLNTQFQILRKLNQCALAGSPTCSNCLPTFLGVASPFGRRRILDFRVEIFNSKIK
ncbi:hypothetical protein FDUTEX481_00953 [Tolypothrix sp. PCC 7601]|nr:hypothetical protein FDUTEX481_00953 [Tolypothrix sp. PCC 7601]